LLDQSQKAEKMRARGDKAR
jgi:hypothetical protein